MRYGDNQRGNRLWINRYIEEIIDFFDSENKLIICVFYSNVVLDLAGMMFKNNKCFSSPELFKNVMRPGIATRTVAMYSNPCFMGIGNFLIALINIIVNSPFFIQPGYNFNPFYNHAFAAILYGAFCAKVQCIVNLTVDANSIYSKNLQAGTYLLTLTRCYPFCYWWFCDIQLFRKIYIYFM